MPNLPQLGPLNPFWRHAIDIAVSVLILRVTLGWLVTYRRLVQFLLLFVALIGMGWIVSQLNLPLAQVLGLILIIPLLVLLMLSIVPEFRRIYESASVGRIFAVRRSREEEMVATIIDTVRQLSENRCGAILVFPKRDDINQFCQGGEQVDARANKSLLLSILNTESPRHDGAIIIDGDRITRIGAVLPLAPAEGVDPSWGTRHLAALGLCQASDAEVIVVSEERGTVSFGKNGRLERVDFADEQAGRRTVAGALEIDLDHTRGKKRLPSSILLWGLAVIIGASGSLGVEGLRNRLYPRPPVIVSATAQIELTGLTNTLFLAQQSHKEAAVRMRLPEAAHAPLADLALFRRKPNLDQLKLTIDLSGEGAGAKELVLQPQMLGQLPLDWQVESFDPNRIQLVLGPIKQLEASIEPQFSPPPKGLKIKTVTVIPPTVRLEIRDLFWTPDRKLRTEKIDISSLTLQQPSPPAATTNAVANPQVPTATNAPPHLPPPTQPEPTEGDFTFAAKLELPSGVKLIDATGKDVVRINLTLMKSQRR
ncbi:MAG TPA: diadenylate cyclase [Verrucomicrobiae bacterium]|nr:diadenylate cyclase [Verrucomicrobiae bacterium]